jgi:hypothetical protein
MLGNIDAVHGLYHPMMHGWPAMFPPTELLLPENTGWRLVGVAVVWMTVPIAVLLHLFGVQHRSTTRSI